MSPEPEKRSDEEEWARLAAAATPGPWKVDRASEAEKFYGDVSFDVFALADGMTVAEGGPTEDGGPHVGACNEADAAFIAASREAVPSLLGALAASRADTERLRAELDAARRWQAQRVVAISQDPTCIKWMRAAEECEEHHGDLLDAIDREQDLRLAARVEVSQQKEMLDEFSAQLHDARREVSQLRAKAEKMRNALTYISSPTMGLPANADAAEYAMSGATEDAARYALSLCIGQARAALAEPLGSIEGGE